MNKKGLLLAISTISCVAMIGSSLLIAKACESKRLEMKREDPIIATQDIVDIASDNPFLFIYIPS